MINYKSFKLNDHATLRIRTDKIIATIHGNNNSIEVYCADSTYPFHVEATKHTPDEIVDYIWGPTENKEIIY